MYAHALCISKYINMYIDTRNIILKTWAQPKQIFMNELKFPISHFLCDAPRLPMHSCSIYANKQDELVHVRSHSCQSAALVVGQQKMHELVWEGVCPSLTEYCTELCYWKVLQKIFLHFAVNAKKDFLFTSILLCSLWCMVVISHMSTDWFHFQTVSCLLDCCARLGAGVRRAGNLC